MYIKLVSIIFLLISQLMKDMKYAKFVIIIIIYLLINNHFKPMQGFYLDLNVLRYYVLSQVRS